MLNFLKKQHTSTMDTTRQLKVSRLIQKEIGEIFQRETRIFFGTALITVTQVRVSPDLSIAKIYVSLFNVPDTQVLLKLIQVHTKEIRIKLSERIKGAFNSPSMRTPGNDCIPLIAMGIDTTVINPLPITLEESLLENENGFLDVKMLNKCHSEIDDLDNISIEDMKDFVENILIPIVSN